MSYSMYLTLVAATAGLSRVCEDSAQPARDLGDTLEPALQAIRERVDRFCQDPVTPLAAAQFEKDLLLALREVGRHGLGLQPPRAG